jgi:hypothetical protein
MADEPDKVVNITMQKGLPVPNPDPVPVKLGCQRITWAADFNFRISIQDHDDVSYPRGASMGTFLAKSGTFSEVRNHKYTIVANGVENDPGIEVKP